MALPSEAHETNNINLLYNSLGKFSPIEYQGVLKPAPKLSGALAAPDVPSTPSTCSRHRDPRDGACA
jgi:hypothetical protein